MQKTVSLTSSTLKPVPDMWIARDGKDVVLDSSPEQLILLRYTGAHWSVTRHPADAQGSSRPNLQWFGSSYAMTGTPVAHLADSDPPERWKTLYRELLSVSA